MCILYGQYNGQHQHREQIENYKIITVESAEPLYPYLICFKVTAQINTAFTVELMCDVDVKVEDVDYTVAEGSTFRCAFQIFLSRTSGTFFIQLERSRTQKS